MLRRPSPKVPSLPALCLAALFSGLAAAPAASSSAPPAATSTAAGIAIGGRVLDGGAGVAGAAVRLEPLPERYDRLRLRFGGEVSPEPAARATTDADGYFRLRAPEVGLWKVVVEAEGRLAAQHLLIPLVDEVELAELELEPPRPVTVRVIDAEGRPRRARLGLYAIGSQRDWRPHLALAETGEDGVARLETGASGKLRIEALAEGLPLGTMDLDPGTVDAVTLHLPPGTAGAVRVVDARRRPVAGAVVLQGSDLLPHGLTGEDGLVRLALATEEPPPVEVLAADGRAGRFEVAFEAAEAVGEEVVELALEPPVQLAGTVIEQESREPVAAAVVWDLRGRMARADPRGGWRLTLPAGAGAFLQATAAGYDVAQARVRNTTDATDAVTFALSPVAMVAGTVVDSEGVGVTGVAVRALPKMASRGTARDLRHGWQTQSGREGRFRMPDLLPGVGYVLVFRKAGFSPERLEVEGLEAFERRTEVRVVLSAGRTGVGRVVDERERPVAGAEVVLARAPATEDSLAVRWRLQHDDEELPRGTSDAEGLFRIADLAAGRYDLEVSAAGFAPARVPGVRVEVGSGEADLGVVALSPGVSIEGRVVDLEGAPIAGAEVRAQSRSAISLARQGPSGEEPSTTGSDGRFRLEDRQEGEGLELYVSAAGFGPRSVSVVARAGGEPVEVELEPTGRLSGRVIDARGEAIEGASLMAVEESRVLRIGRRRGWVSSDADGRFVLEEVPAGLVTLHVNASGYRDFRLQGLDLAPGEELAEIEVVLEQGVRLTGTVRDARGEPVAEAVVTATEVREGSFGGASGGTSTDAEGRYRLDDVEPGLVRVEAGRGGRKKVSRTLELAPGSHTVDLVLEAGFEVSGRVVDAEGMPLADVGLWLREAAGGRGAFLDAHQPEESSARDGAFAFSDVGPGEYRLSAVKPGFARGGLEAGVVVEAADVRGLEVVLGRGATVHGRVLGLEIDELSGLNVVAFSLEGGTVEGRVDYEGKYRLEALAPGAWTVHANRVGGGRAISEHLTLEPGEVERELDLVFEEGFPLSGEVSADGRPVAGAYVAVHGGEAQGSANTDSLGRFRLEGLPAGTYTLTLGDRSGLRYSREIEITGPRELRIELESGRIAGVVLSALDERPLAGVQIRLEALAAEAGAGGVQSVHAGGAQTDSLGRFHTGRVAAGTWRLVARAEGHAPAEVVVEVASGGETRELELRLEPTEGLTFEAVLESGTSPREVYVAVHDTAGRQLSVGPYTRHGGLFRITSVAPGPHVLWLKGAESVPVRHEVVAPGHAGRIVLPAGGSLRVVVDELATDVGMARVYPDGVAGTGPGSLLGYGLAGRQFLLTRGQTTLEHLPPGGLKLRVQHQDGRVWHAEATVVAGAVTEVRPERE